MDAAIDEYAARGFSIPIGPSARGEIGYAIEKAKAILATS